MMLTHSPYQATPDSKTWDPKQVGENKGKRPEHFAKPAAKKGGKKKKSDE